MSVSFPKRPMGLCGLTCIAVLIALSGCGKVEQPPSSAPDVAAEGPPLKIAVIPKGTTHAFWKSVEAGAKQAGGELKVEIIWKGPLKENDRAQQIQIVEQFVTEGVDGIVLAPLDDTALQRPVAEARKKGIPVVIFDSALKGEAGKDFISFVATNNRKGGGIGGEKLARLLGNQGKVVLLRYQEGSASTDEREAGFLEVIKGNSNMQVTVDNRFAGATVGEAKEAAMNMLSKLQEADGIFCPNKSSTFGMLLALRQNNLAGKKKFVGFDTSEPLIEALKKGEIDALVAQNPKKMGYIAVEAVVKHLRAQPDATKIGVSSEFDTGAALVTRDNLDDPQIKEILQIQ